MTTAQALIPEFDREMANTRQVLERIPDDKLDWKAHPKFNSIGWVACHIAEMAGWIEGILTTDSFDVNPPGGPAYATPTFKSTKEILASFDQGVAGARKALESISDADFEKNWSLLNAGETWISMPRTQMVRTFSISHLIHHRAFLCCYLRMNDIKVPGMYGPGGDD
ncbi:MAG TPA: DinB family protein [Caulifigura sp.]|jgi:uncharacterized damage-inducible protein DinB|nr:DinB family protein [Caulifigura sp.]